MLKTAGFSLPTKVHIHGFLTVGGEKMSKSKGTFVTAAMYLKHLDPAYLRYYFSSKLGPRLDDLDLNPDEFVDKVNADLVALMRDPAVVRQFEDRATLADPLTPAEFAAFMAKDMATWAEVVKATGTKPGN